jgi:hypothetical protein
VRNIFIYSKRGEFRELLQGYYGAFLGNFLKRFSRKFGKIGRSFCKLIIRTYKFKIDASR